MNTGNESYDKDTMRNWNETFAGFRYQICIVVDYADKFRPSIKCVLGRLGSRDLPADSFDALPWAIWREDLIIPDNRKTDSHLVYGLIPLFLLARLYASRAEERQKKKSDGKLLDVFSITRKEFQEFNLMDIFDSIYNTVTTLQRIEGPYIGRAKRKLSLSCLTYDALAFLCPRIQASSYSYSTDNMDQPSGLLSHSFGRWPGRMTAPKTISSKVSAPFGPSDVCLSNWSLLSDKYKRILAADGSLAIVDVPFRIIQQADICRSHTNTIESNPIISCIVAFAYRSLPYSCRQPTRDDIDNFKAVVARNIDNTRPEINMSACAMRLRNNIEHLVNRDSDGTLAVERAYTIMFRGRQDNNDQSVTPLLTVEQILKSTKCPVVVISGDPGQGKSTSLRHLAWRLAEPHMPSDTSTGLIPYFPVFVSAWNCRKGLIRAIAQQITPSGRRTYRNEQCENIMASGSWLIILDGYDDLLDSIKCREDIEEIIARNPRLVIIISTRPSCEPNFAGIRSQVYSPHFSSSTATIAAYLERHGVDRAKAESAAVYLNKHSCLKVLGSPLLLWGVALFLQKHITAHIPLAPGRLLDMIIIDHYLDHWESKKERRQALQDIETEDILAGLGYLAYMMVSSDGGADMQVSVVDQLMYQHVRDTRHELCRRPTRQLRAAAIYSKLLVKSTVTTIRFNHSIFRDYFAARHIAATLPPDQADGRLLELVELIKWDGVLEVLCGIVNPQLRQTCVEVASKCDPYYATRLCLSSGTSDQQSELMIIVVNRLDALSQREAISIPNLFTLLKLLLCRRTRGTIFRIAERETERILMRKVRDDESALTLMEFLSLSGLEESDDLEYQIVLSSLRTDLTVIMETNISDVEDDTSSPPGIEALVERCCQLLPALISTSKANSADPRSANLTIALEVVHIQGVVMMNEGVPDLSRLSWLMELICLVEAIHKYDIIQSILIDTNICLLATRSSTVLRDYRHELSYLFLRTGRRFGGALIEGASIIGLWHIGIGQPLGRGAETYVGRSSRPHLSISVRRVSEDQLHVHILRKEDDSVFLRYED